MSILQQFFQCVMMNKDIGGNMINNSTTEFDIRNGRMLHSAVFSLCWWNCDFDTIAFTIFLCDLLHLYVMNIFEVTCHDVIDKFTTIFDFSHNVMLQSDTVSSLQ